jgi:hypothetical protein
MRRGRQRVPLAPVEAPLPTEREDAMLDELQALLDVRAQHHADMERIDAGDLAGTDSVTVFAVLRDIADAEPLTAVKSYDTDVGVECTMCGAESITPYEQAMDAAARGEPAPAKVPAAQMYEVPPLQHLVSCPWHRATQIVGVKTDG